MKTLKDYTPTVEQVAIISIAKPFTVIGWTRVVYLDMSDATQNCPTGFRLYTIKGKRYCGRLASNNSSCAPVGFSTNGISYSQICGRFRGICKR